MIAIGLAGWLAQAGLRNMPLEELVDGFGRRLNEAGLHVERLFVGMNTLHPMIRARSLIWDTVRGINQHFHFSHGEIASAYIQESPFAAMLRAGMSEQRRRFDTAADAAGVPLFEELIAAGMTEWMGWVQSFGELSPQVGSPTEVEHAEGLWLVFSAATDRPGGFRDEEVAYLREVLPVFAVAVKATTLRGIDHGLLAAYLGNDPASRVLSGTVLRGEVQSVEAVLFFTDLRGFTALADTMPGGDLITLLDDYFNCMVQPIVAHDGEVLKFMGDGMLAAFAVISGNRAEVCADGAGRRGGSAGPRRGAERRAAKRRTARHVARHLPAYRPRPLRQCRHRHATRFHGDRSGRERGLAHRGAVPAARPGLLCRRPSPRRRRRAATAWSRSAATVCAACARRRSCSV